MRFAQLNVPRGKQRHQRVLQDHAHDTLLPVARTETKIRSSTSRSSALGEPPDRLYVIELQTGVKAQALLANTPSDRDAMAHFFGRYAIARSRNPILRCSCPPCTSVATPELSVRPWLWRVATAFNAHRFRQGPAPPCPPLIAPLVVAPHEAMYTIHKRSYPHGRGSKISWMQQTRL